jgi:hypothetical protein
MTTSNNNNNNYYSTTALNDTLQKLESKSIAQRCVFENFLIFSTLTGEELVSWFAAIVDIVVSCPSSVDIVVVYAASKCIL